VTDYKAPTVTGLIVGGKTANRGQFPWYVCETFADYFKQTLISSGLLLIITTRVISQVSSAVEV
jgi:hypothetical protein